MKISRTSTMELRYEMSFKEFVRAMWGSVDGDSLPEDGEGVVVENIVIDADAEFVTIDLRASGETEIEK